MEDVKINKKIISPKKDIILPKEETSIIEGYKKIEKSKKKINIINFFKKNNTPHKIKSTPYISSKPRIVSKVTSLFFIISLIVGVMFWGGNIFQRANVEIVSKHQNIKYNKKQFLASKDGNANSINFEIMIVSDKKVKSIILTEPKDISEKGNGTITLYNEFTTTPQKLLAGTFLVDNNGKTYKTDSAVTIPGYKLDSKKKVIPGQITVNITAFLAGEVYNGSPSDFHINSFKGTTKYNKIYGKPKTDITGGALGLFYVLSDQDKNKIKTIAESSFKDDLINKVKALVPPGYILYKDAINFSYKVPEDLLSVNPEAEIEIEGILSVVLLDQKSLFDNIIKTSLGDISKQEIKEIVIPNLNNFSFSFVNKEQLISKDIDSISFLLDGNTEAIWRPDTDLLKMKLSGIEKTEVLPIFAQDKGINSALVKIFPPWQKNIPSDITKINILVK